MRLQFSVAGVPIPQGSKRGFARGRKVQLVDDNKELLKPWREKVAGLATLAHGDRPQFEGAVRVACLFVFVRPKTVKRTHMSVKPDVDKLCRAICDSLTDSKVLQDDARVVALDPVKVYGASAGVQIVVTDVKEDERLAAAWLARNKKGNES